MVVVCLFCFDMFLYGIDLFMLTNFMDYQYGKAKCSSFQKHLLLIFVTIFSCTMLWYSPFGGTYPFFSVIFSFAFLPFYISNKQKKLLFSAIQLVISSYLAALILALLKSFNINLKYIGINYYITIAVMHIAFWILILLLRYFSNRNNSNLPNELLRIVLSIPISSFIVLLFFLVRINNNEDILFSLEIPLLCVFIFINTITAFVYTQFCKLLMRNNEVLLLKQQINLSEQHFRHLTSMQQKIKGIKHDMKNHLQALLFMTKQTPVEIDDIQKYIQKLLSNTNDTSQVISTGNLGIDAILSVKITQINESQIPIDSKILIPPNIKIAFDDSIIILGNILDNAINACKKLQKENSWIRLEMNYMPHSLFIRISNPMPVLNKHKNIKMDDVEHGFGLKNVHTTIQKYNGLMEIDNDNTVFTIKIVLYNI